MAKRQIQRFYNETPKSPLELIDKINAPTKRTESMIEELAVIKND